MVPGLSNVLGVATSFLFRWVRVGEGWPFGVRIVNVRNLKEPKAGLKKNERGILV